ncbi:YcxB family protein [Puniceicoccus vermicola]|uniref:YcxB family protein n=1 Tax=Puniceicoccus vermicola TaxID=388746 RepID=A0A7X1AW06_9BACT|nr:YcxB family protein [Puniceicoccus vermicola]MBC2600972.1 YcxB family protein [Puniceicoccus vermicola]
MSEVDQIEQEPSYEVRYSLTPQLQRQAAHEMFFNVILGKKWMGVVGFAAASLVCLMFSDVIPWVFPAVFLGLTLYLLFVWIRGYFLLRKKSLEALKSVESTETLLVLEGHGLTVWVGSGARTAGWSDMSGLVETKNFFMPLENKLPVVCIPKRAMGEEAKDFLLTQCDEEE